MPEQRAATRASKVRAVALSPYTGGSAGVLGVLVVLWQVGIIGPRDGAKHPAAPPPAEGDAERPPKTSERVARVEVVLDGMKADAKETRDEVVALKVEQRAVGVRLDGVKEQIDRMAADERQRAIEQARQMDRVIEKLDDVAVGVRRRRDR